MKKVRYKEIFVFIAGSTPQVITETLCSLGTGKPPIYPDELCIITTSRGREIAENTFFRKGLLKKLIDEPEFESNPDFFYKPKKDRIIECNGKRLDTKNACITLAELPFIRLRNKLSLEGSSFRELVQEGQREIDIALLQPELKVMLKEGALRIGQKTVRLTPLHFVIYLAYLKRKTDHCKYPERPYCLDCSDCFPSLLELSTKTVLEEMAKNYMQISPSKVHDLLLRHKEGLSPEILRQAISKIKRLMLEELKDEALALCCSITTAFRGYANTRHGIRLEKAKIKIE